MHPVSEAEQCCRTRKWVAGWWRHPPATAARQSVTSSRTTHTMGLTLFKETANQRQAAPVVTTVRLWCGQVPERDARGVAGG